MIRPMWRATTLLAVAATVASAQAPSKVPPRPTPGLMKLPVFPKITTETLPNGLRLAVIENRTLPIVAVRLGFAGGYFVDTPGKEGGWTLMTSLLPEGSTTRNAAAMAEAAADYGTTIDWSQSQFNSGAPTFTTVRSAFAPVLGLVADLLMHPAFPADAFRRVQGVQAATAARLPQVTAAINLFNATLFGANHPYGRPPIGTEASVRALTRDDIVALHTTYVRPQNTVVVVSGDVTPAQARAIVEQAFATWERSGTTVEPTIPTPLGRTEQTTIYLRDDPGARTSTMYEGLLVPGRGGSDAAAIEAVNTALGGVATSRMWRAFRSERGLSYSPGTAFLWHPEPQAGVWLALAPQIPAEKTDTAVTESLRIIRETQGTRPLTAAELDFARSSLVGAFPGQIATVGLVANATLGLIQTRLPTTFYRDYITRLNGLSLDQFQAAAAKYLDPDHLVIAVVGDRARIEARLRATGIPVVIVDH